MDIRVSDAAAVEIKRMVEQRAIALLGGLQFLEELGEERHMEGVDLRHALDFRRIVAVVGKRMVRIGHSDLRIGSVARFAC